MIRFVSVLRMAAVAALVSVSGWHAAHAAASAVDRVAHLTGPERQKILEEGARREGALMFYTTLIVNQAVRPLKTGFEKKYPFIDFRFVRSGSSKTVGRILAEYRAGTSLADVVVATGGPILRKAGVLESYTTPALAAYPKGDIGPQHMWARIRYSYNGIGYNTRLVSTSDAPKTWADLLDPKWKGKLVWSDSTGTGAPFFISVLRAAWGEDKAIAYLKRLSKQGVHTAGGSSRHVLDRVVAGEYPVMISAALHHVAISANKGAPVASSKAPGPVLGRIGYAMLLKAAPHPHAAMLFIDFLLSKEGQTILRNAHYFPARPDVDALPEMQAVTPSATGASVYVLTPDQEDDLRNRSLEIYHDLFQ